MLLSKTIHRPACRGHSGRRTIFTEVVQVLSNAYVELALSLPYPPTWPPYTSTIILVGVFSRVALFPISVWAQERNRRLEGSVVPFLNAYRAKLERANHKIPASQPARKRPEIFVSQKLKEKRAELFKEHRCNPWVTLLVPPGVQIPIYLAFSAALYNEVSGTSSVLRDEAFLTVTSLGLPDPTMTFPIALGLVSLASIETSRWFSTEERMRRLAAQEKNEEMQRARGKMVIRPSNLVKSAMRGLSVGRIVLAAMVPGSIEIYWLTSATCGLFQNWALNWNDHRRRWHDSDINRTSRNEDTRLRQRTRNG